MSDFIEAAKTGDVKQLRRLELTGSVDINFPCPPDGTTALYWAACNGHVMACDWLLRHSAKVNLATEKSGSTPLHGAVDRGHYDCVKLLLISGADVRIRTRSNGDTPLHLAAYRGHLDVCRLLLETGACAQVLNKQGRSPIQEAQIKGHYDIYRLIHKHLSDVQRRKDRFERWSTTEVSTTSRFVPTDDAEGKMISEPLFWRSSSWCHPTEDGTGSSKRRNGAARWTDDAIDDSLETDSPEEAHSTSGGLIMPPMSSIAPFSCPSQRDPEVAECIRKSAALRELHGYNANSLCAYIPKITSACTVTESKVGGDPDVITNLVQRFSKLRSYVKELEIQVTDKDDRLADLIRENDVLTMTLFNRDLELEEERRLNADLRRRIAQTEADLERLRTMIEFRQP